MVFIKKRFDPDTNQAILQVTLRTSPTLSLSAPEATLLVTLGVRIASAAPAHAGKPLTVCTSRTVLDVFEPGQGVDMFARGAFGRIVSTTGEEDRKISLGLFRVNERWDDGPDMIATGHEFVTVPGDGSEVEISHRLGWERIFRYEERLTKGDLRVGERFRVGVNSGYVSTMWWCFGDLEGDLKGKKFHQWSEDQYGFNGEKPSDEFVEEGNWVLGRDRDCLYWEIKRKDEDGVFEVVQ